MTHNIDRRITEYKDLIIEHEVDGSWENHVPEQYRKYRKQYDLVLERKYDGHFPLCVEVEASYHCNLKCTHCSRAINSGERGKKHMSPELWNIIVKEIRKNNLYSIMMDHEAESLMNPNFINMLNDVQEAGVIDIWLHTNGNLLNSSLSEQLIDGGLTKINFSIDAATEGTYNNIREGGDFGKVVNNVKEFIKIKLKKRAFHLRTRVSFVVQKANRHEYDQFYEFWKKVEGLNLISFQKYIDFTVFAKPDEDRFLNETQLQEKYKHHTPFYCSKPWEMPIIDVNGNVIPCGAPVRENFGDFILGNLLEKDTIESCWNSDKLINLKKIHNEGKWYLNSMCRTCVKALKHSSV